MAGYPRRQQVLVEEANLTLRGLSTQTIFIPVGLPCAGKTSFFRCLSDMDGVGDNLALVSPDEIREEVYPGYAAGMIPFSSMDNGEIFPRAYARMERYILDGWDVWFDAVNGNHGARLMIYGHAERVRREAEFKGGDLLRDPVSGRAARHHHHPQRGEPGRPPSPTEGEVAEVVGRAAE